MKIRMKGLACGPFGHLRSDQIYEVDDALGRQLIDEAQAEKVDESQPVARPEVDTTLPPLPEFTAETGALKSKQRRF